VSGAILAGSASGNVLFACLSDGRVYRGDLDGHWASNGIPVGGQCNGLAADPRDGQVTQNSSIAIYQTPAGNLEVSIIDHSSGTKQNLGFAERAGPRGSGRPGVWVVPANFTEPTGVAYDIFAADGIGFYRYLHPGWSARFDLHDDTWWMAFPSSHQAISVVDRLYAFAEGSDGQLWVNWWDGSQWQWSAQGMPPGATVADTVGTLTVGRRPHVFVRGSDGQLWINWYDGSSWRWTNQGTPPGATLVRGGGALKILNSGPAYAADDGGIQFDAGNLEWVGASHGLHAIFSIKISGYYRSDSSTSDCPVYNDDGELCPTLFLPSADDDTFIRSTGVGQPTIYDWDNFNDYLGDSGEVLIDPAQPSHALAVRNLTYMMFVNPDGTAPPFSKSAFQHYADE